MEKRCIDSIEQPKLGHLIRRLRQEMKLTQEKFAQELGVVYSTVNKWENGKTMPSPLALTRIQEKLNLLADRGENILDSYLN